MEVVNDAVIQIAGLSNTTSAQNTPGAAGAQEASAHDIASYRQSMERAQTLNPATSATPEAVTPAESEGLRAVFSTLDTLNGRAQTLEQKSSVFTSGDRDMSPGDMLMLTVESHEFLFHCELTANVANRTSDGVQQLFRQQG
ncbi:MAG: hypothetical protein AB8G16_14395 [Gammaproteobacteria bacterium]